MVKKLGAGQFGEVWMGKKPTKVQLRNVPFVQQIFILPFLAQWLVNTYFCSEQHELSLLESVLNFFCLICSQIHYLDLNATKPTAGVNFINTNKM